MIVKNPISFRSFSPYMYYDDLNNYIKNDTNGFSVLSSNISRNIISGRAVTVGKCTLFA